MSRIDWGAHLELGIQEVDEEHQKLVAVVNKLYDGLFEANGREIIVESLNDLVDFVEVHFVEEERIFQEYDYPGAKEHIKLHKVLANKVFYYQDSVQAGKEILSIDLLDDLTKWLTDHIQIHDRDYANFINDKEDG